jgi:hypothetical protein
MSPSGSLHGPGGHSTSSFLQYHNTLLEGQQDDSVSPILLSGDEDGGKTKRPRRVSSSVVVQKDRLGVNVAKNRRRGLSLSMLGMQNQLSSNNPQHQQQHSIASQHPLHHQQQQAAMQSSFAINSPLDSSLLSLRRTNSFANSLTNSEASSLSAPASSSWSVDVHDSDIWTIVGTDIARYTFYLPNKLVDGIKARVERADHGIAHLINVPAPATPITPMPMVHSFTRPKNASWPSSAKDDSGSLTARAGQKQPSPSKAGGSSSSSNSESTANHHPRSTILGLRVRECPSSW